jgi:Amt family ammonium transporter
VGAKILGPRTGRFERPGDFDGHSTPLQLIGTFLLWFGWCARMPPHPFPPPPASPRGPQIALKTPTMCRPPPPPSRYGFNPGSTLVIHGYAHTMARTAVTTTLSAAMGGLTGLLVKRCMPKKLGGSGLYDIGHTCNSLLGALVGITAGCATVHPWAAILIGIIAAFVYHAASYMTQKRTPTLTRTLTPMPPRT